MYRCKYINYVKMTMYNKLLTVNFISNLSQKYT